VKANERFWGLNIYGQFTILGRKYLWFQIFYFFLSYISNSCFADYENNLPTGIQSFANWGLGGWGCFFVAFACCHSLKCFNFFPYPVVNNYLTCWKLILTSLTIITMKRRILTLPLDSVSPPIPVSTIKITQNKKITNLESISN
jgi:hypothetical protein